MCTAPKSTRVGTTGDPGAGWADLAPGYYEPTPYDRIGDRRVVPVAIIDCAHENAGPNVIADVEAFALMFLTEPVGEPPDENIWAEMLGSSIPATRAAFCTTTRCSTDEVSRPQDHRNRQRASLATTGAASRSNSSPRCR